MTESLGGPPCSQLTGFPGHCNCVPPCGTVFLCLLNTHQLAPPHPTPPFTLGTCQALSSLCAFALQAPCAPHCHSPALCQGSVAQRSLLLVARSASSPLSRWHAVFFAPLSGALEYHGDFYHYPFCLWMAKPGSVTRRGLWASTLVCECTLRVTCVQVLRAGFALAARQLLARPCSCTCAPVGMGIAVQPQLCCVAAD